MSPMLYDPTYDSAHQSGGQRPVQSVTIPGSLTPGIVAGLNIQVVAGQGSGPTNSGLLVVHPGTAVSTDRQLVEVDRPVEVDVSRLLVSGSVHELEVVLIDGQLTEARDNRTHVVVRAKGSRTIGAVPIANVAWTATLGLTVAPVFAGLAARRLRIGSPRHSHLEVNDGRVIATGSIRIAAGGHPTDDDDGSLVVGRDDGPGVRVDNWGVEARSDGRASVLNLQRKGGGTRFGGAIEGPERDPLNIVGGSDLSLGGGGVVMLGHAGGPNLVLDENEVMARDNGRSAPLTLQCDGGETRFGGPLRGTAGGPLRIVGGSDLSLGGDGVLLIGSPESQHLVLDENEIMAGNGNRTANLYLQWQGGGTSFGGPISGPDQRPLTVAGPARFEGPLQLTTDGPSLEVHHGGRLSGWLEPSPSGRMVERCEREWIVDPKEMRDALDVVERLMPVTYCLAEGSEKTAVGFVAEEVADVAPDLVSEMGGSLGIRPADFAIIAIAAIKEQQQQISELKRIVASLGEAVRADGSTSHPDNTVR